MIYSYNIGLNERFAIVTDREGRSYRVDVTHQIISSSVPIEYKPQPSWSIDFAKSFIALPGMHAHLPTKVLINSGAILVELSQPPMQYLEQDSSNKKRTYENKPLPTNTPLTSAPTTTTTTTASPTEFSLNMF